jgi:hypothetical protein
MIRLPLSACFTLARYSILLSPCEAIRNKVLEYLHVL